MMSSYSRLPALSLSAAQKTFPLGGNGGPGRNGGPGGNDTWNAPVFPPPSPVVSLSGMASSLLIYDAILIAYASNAVKCDAGDHGRPVKALAVSPP
jgi:hypothetical protein